MEMVCERRNATTPEVEHVSEYNPPPAALHQNDVISMYMLVNVGVKYNYR